MKDPSRESTEVTPMKILLCIAISSTTRSCSLFYYESVDKCTCYSVTADLYKIYLVDTFVKAVKNLPISRNDQEYRFFISNYGTHYTKQIIMGAKVVMRSSFTKAAWTEMQKEVFNIEQGAKATLGPITGEVQSGVSYNKEIERNYNGFCYILPLHLFRNRASFDYVLGSAPVPLRFHSGSTPVPLRFYSGFAPVPLRFHSGSAPVPLRFYSGFAPDPLRFRSGRALYIRKDYLS